ncbi:archaellin/type IV pilin N-terminal domain-containing protein [Methermicoccus shengliensis]|uniref:archaellin/type IV pilin N-terminal domain-containing protein n=1 Tax=Methermicoccus shengliensis TaxID=660064 RepID=UPI0005B2D9E7|nr:archaellin/type IV pilin N-terminal domain-containing protein [Methermicoccus shengliensis]
MRRMLKDNRGFTGLEAAIVLIAFVTVAAVFSYVLLSAGFFTTQKSQEVVHTGVKQATSSIELVGSIVATGNTTSDNIANTTFTIQLAAGGNPINLNDTVITVLAPQDGTFKELDYMNSTNFDSDVANNSADHYRVEWIYSLQGDTPDDYIEELEKAEITLCLSDAGFDLGPNEDFIIEVKPPAGATYPIELTVPPSIDSVMVLLK